MLNTFDWIRRCKTGTELLATLETINRKPILFDSLIQIGAPHSALNGPCHRCWIYPRIFNANGKQRYCRVCMAIVRNKYGVSKIIENVILLWGYLDQIPESFTAENLDYSRVISSFILDSHSFLLAIKRIKLTSWLKEFVIHYGGSTHGLLQIFPTLGSGKRLNMSDVLTRVIYYQTSFPLNALYVRFYAQPRDVIYSRKRDKAGKLQFEISEFLSLLEGAKVFRTLLFPPQQQELYRLLITDHPVEEQFYWGRFIGGLSQEAKDLLDAWNIRKWPRNRIELLYELLEYAEFNQGN